MNSEKNSDHITYSDQIKRLTQIGKALSAEKNIDRLLEVILDEAQKYTYADGGTIYIMSDDEAELLFAIIRNEFLGVHMGGSGGKITWPAVKLINTDGSPNYSNVSAYVAISGETVNISDVYNAKGFNFEGTKKFDQETGYHSKSMLVVPMRNHENEIIGVLQLLNAKDPTTGTVIDFSPQAQEMAISLSSQAAVALSNNILIQDLGNLLESFIKTIATAIDEKSPYTGGHIRRVAELTMFIAEKINERKQGKFAVVNFSEDQLRELRIAAWLHDIGKITTPEHVVSKATKLEIVYDLINDIKIRIELIKRDYLLAGGSNVKNKQEQNIVSKENIEKEISKLDDEYRFLKEINNKSDLIGNEEIARIKQIASRQWKVDGKTFTLLTGAEINNLSIRYGTLNDEERGIINNHAAVTYKMLSQLPFPKKMRRIAEYAAAHHEKLDGSGYPLGLKDEELSLQSRIIALADIFEALTAQDRPYKQGKTLSEALKTMEMMVRDHHIDGDLYELFVKEKIYSDYAKRELAQQQIDI